MRARRGRLLPWIVAWVVCACQPSPRSVAESPASPASPAPPAKAATPTTVVAPLPSDVTAIAAAPKPVVSPLSGAVRAGAEREPFFNDTNVVAAPPLRRALLTLTRQRPTQGLIDLLRADKARATAALVRCGWHRSANLRRQVPELLTLIGARPTDAVMAYLRRSLTQEPDRDVRAQVAKVSAHLANASLLPVLVRVVSEDQAGLVRAHAATALGRIGDSQAASSLRAALKDSIPAVRREALESLRRVEGRAALEVLKPLKNDPHPAVRYAAGRAVRQLKRQQR